MKKILFAILAVSFVSSLCFAQQAKAPVAQSAPVETKTFTGKVESVTIGDLTKGVKPEIVVVDESGQKLNFSIKSYTTFTAPDGKALTLNELKNDNKVTITYTTNQAGMHKAESVKVLG
jgi:nitrous oxide reductase accessory protein NosL